MNVLVIPEDFRKDQFILEPVVRAMLDHLGRVKARVTVCKDPLLGGVAEALKWERIEEILERYRGMVDLFLLLVDRDGKAGRKRRLTTLENRSSAHLRNGAFLAENAWQEVEVWVLAGNPLPKGWVWASVRSDLDPKEAYFLPYARQRGVAEGPGEGRRVLSIEAARNYRRIRQLCAEVKELERRVSAVCRSA